MVSLTEKIIHLLVWVTALIEVIGGEIYEIYEIRLFLKCVPILGLVENMAYFTPAELPNNKYYIFGKDGAKSLAKELGVALLAQIPIVQSICESGDAGEPAATKVDSITGQAFLSLAQSVITVVNRRNSEQEPTKIVKMHS